MSRALMFVLLVVPLAWSADAQDGSDAPLYLQPPERENDPANFTTYPPNGTQPVLVDPVSRDITTTIWRWTFAGMPAAWDLEQATILNVTLWIENLDRALPNTEVPDDPANAGAVRITAGLIHGSLTPFVSGTTYHRPPATPAAGAVKVVVAVPVDKTVHFEAARSGIFGLHVEVAAQTTADTILGVWVDGDTASSVSIPGFPRDAFRAWEDESRARRTCLQQLQQQEPCATPTPDPEDEDDDARRSPGPGLLVVPLSLLVVLLVRSVRRRD